MDKGNIVLQELSRNGSLANEELFASIWRSAKDRCTKLLGVQRNTIALLPNFSFGINAICDALDANLKVLLFRKDYPGLTIPFTARPFNIHWVEANNQGFYDEQQILESIQKNKIDVVALSHVQYITGQQVNLERLATICKDEHVELIIDSTQSFGHLALNAAIPGISALLASGYKWINAGQGSAVLHVRHDFHDRFAPKVAGHASVRYSDQGWTYAPGINSYQPGHLSLDKVAMLSQALGNILEKGIHRIQSEGKAMADQCREMLRESPFNPDDNPNSIVSFEAPSDFHDLLAKSGIICTYYDGRIRMGFHHQLGPDDMQDFRNRFESSLENLKHHI